MNRKQERLCTMRGMLSLLLVTVAALNPSAATQRPEQANIVIIFCDDLGYADLGCFGAKDWRTPNLDRMAKEGTRFTRFYAAQPVCSASRGALMAGCYPSRVGIQGALFPDSKIGLHPEEVTLAELLKQRGCATAILGKWHLGFQPQFLPTRQGFDEYFGLPYSNQACNDPGTAQIG